MYEEKVKSLQKTAVELRKTVLEMIYTAGSGHPGGSLSAADIMTVLYFDEMNIRPKEPDWADRDRFVLSKGHVCPILYSCLALKGYFPMSEILTLRKLGSMLQGHPDMKRVPGLDMSSGSLGQGISCAVGMALALKQDNKPSRVFCLVGDGECDEGQVWEAIETAVKYKLDNLIVFVDWNGLQNDGFTEDIMPSLDLTEKFKAFGAETYNIDGHDIEQILTTLDKIRKSAEPAPKVVTAKTVKGKGVSFMENVAIWHGIAPNNDEYLQAISELEART